MVGGIVDQLIDSSADYHYILGPISHVKVMGSCYSFSTRKFTGT